MRHAGPTIHLRDNLPMNLGAPELIVLLVLFGVPVLLVVWLVRRNQ